MLSLLDVQRRDNLDGMGGVVNKTDSDCFLDGFLVRGLIGGSNSHSNCGHFGRKPSFADAQFTYKTHDESYQLPPPQSPCQ